MEKHYHITISKFDNGKYQCYIREYDIKKRKIGKAVSDGWLPRPSGNYWTIKKIVKEFLGISIPLASELRWGRINSGEKMVEVIV